MQMLTFLKLEMNSFASKGGSLHPHRRNHISEVLKVDQTEVTYISSEQAAYGSIWGHFEEPGGFCFSSCFLKNTMVLSSHLEGRGRISHFAVGSASNVLQYVVWSMAMKWQLENI